jgi:hypothetical protein
MSIGGTLERAKRIQRFYIDFKTGLQTTIEAGRMITIEKPYRLQYRGSAKGNLIVFARQIDQELVHLIILDLTHEAPAQGNLQ